MVKHLAPYRTYVIRCWQEHSGQPGTCIYRFSLEIPATGERFGFTRSKDLIQALEGAISEIQIPVRAEAEGFDQNLGDLSH